VVWKRRWIREGKIKAKSCVRTIVVWKLLNVIVSLPIFLLLRENHSGMETNYREVVEDPRKGCVRTIVVWKQICRRWMQVHGLVCCVRTIVVWKPYVLSNNSLVRLTLRENHSGMETFTTTIFS